MSSDLFFELVDQGNGYYSRFEEVFFFFRVRI